MEDLNKDFKPCPFCGKVPEVVQADRGSWKGFCRAFHRCEFMGYIEIHDWNEKPYADKWNTRVKEDKE